MVLKAGVRAVKSHGPYTDPLMDAAVNGQNRLALESSLEYISQLHL